MSDKASSAPECEHFWSSHCFGGRSMQVCMRCGWPNLDDLDEQTSKARAEGERAATERIVNLIERLGDGYENQHGKEREVIDDVLYEIREGRAQ